MSKKHHRRPRVVHHRRDHRPEPDLLSGVRDDLGEDHPLALLVTASQFMEITRERPLDAVTGRSPSTSREQLLESFIGVVRPETTALLEALALFVTDEPFRSRIEGELSKRNHRLPGWVGELGHVSVTAAAEMADVLGDGENVMVELTWPNGQQLTLVAYIDHNMGTVVKDAYPIPEGLSEVLLAFERHREEGTTISDIDPAEARARIQAAVAEGEHLFPPPQTDTWPGCREIVEWAARALPEGGVGYRRPEWSDGQRMELVEQFLGSSFAKELELESEHRDLAEFLVRFACDYGPGDPLRWSPVSVEIALVDWFPRKVVDTVRTLERLPATLRAFVRFAHAERNIPARFTNETLDAVDQWAPQYRAAISDPDRPMGLAGLVTPHDVLAGLGVDEQSHEEYMLDRLAHQVGGTDALDRLDPEPIADEPFDWDPIPADIEAEVRKVLDLTDRCSDELLDVEYRTIIRRLLARVASGDPDVFRRGASPEYTAAGLVWMAGKANNLFRGTTVKSVTAWFGLSGSASQKVKTLRKAVGLSTEGWHTETALGDPDLLHSEKRRDLITWRDRYRKNMPPG